MTQVSKYPIRRDVYDEIFKTFSQVIVSLSDKREASEFFDEFLTPNERLMFAKRIAVGLMIAENFNYRDILELLKVSNYTISSYSSRYKYGTKYKRVIDRIKTTKEINQIILEFWEVLTSVGHQKIKGTKTLSGLSEEFKKRKSKLIR